MSTPYEIEMDLRWSDQDAQGHVNNAKIVTLAEEARIRFHRFLASQRQGGGEGGGLVVVRQEIDYHAQTTYTPTITMQVGVLRIGTKSYTLRQRGIQDGRRVFTVDTVMVNLDHDGLSRVLTEGERTGLGAWQWPEDPSTT